MNLPFFKEKKEKPEYYLALLLTDDKASSIILEAILGKIKIIASREEPFSSSIEDIPLEEFINVIDKAVSKAEEILPPDIETHKTVFGVKESWIEEETKKIKKEHLGKLKKMCDSLDLSPVGFMVTSEAITHLLQDEEGAPLSAIVADIEKKQITVKLLRGGKTIESTSGPIQESVPATVDTLLKHFTVPVLPARIILLHIKSGEELSQQFITHQWSKSLPFLHVPQITLLPSGFDARAVMFGAATQMGFEVLETGEKETPQEVTMPENEEIVEEETETSMTFTEITEIVEETKEDNMLDEKELAAESDTQETEEKTHSKPLPKEGATSFGFVVGQDISEIKPHAPTLQVHYPHQEENIHEYEQHHEVNKAEDEEKPRNAKTSGLAGIISLINIDAIKNSMAPLKRMQLPNFGKLQLHGNMVRIGVPLFIVFLLIVGGIFYYLYHVKVHVVLTATPKMVDQTESVTFSISSPSDFSKKIIAAKPVSATVDGELAKDATGKKEIGDKAKGSVTIINKDFSKKQLDSGTIITSNNDLDFSLDKDVTIASASGDDSGIKFGTADVAVSAKAIGTESNLPSGIKFTVGGSSTLTAKNNSAFSGGTKKVVTAVSKDDLAQLRAGLPKIVEDKAKEELSKKATGNVTVLPLLLNPVLEKESFDKKIGDETKKVKISANVVFDGISYQNDELKSFIQSILKNKTSENASFAQNSIKQEIKDTKEKNAKEITANISISAGLLPEINTNDVAKQINGKSLGQAKEILANLPQIAKSDITFSPSIPWLPNIFPQLPKDITVEIKNE